MLYRYYLSTALVVLSLTSAEAELALTRVIEVASNVEEVVINGDVVKNGAAPLVVHAKLSKGAEQGA